MNLYPLAGLVMLMPMLASAASAAESVHAFVPGQPMQFPMSSAGVADDLVRLLSVNCNADDSSVESSCKNLLRERAENCGPQPPDVFKSKKSYQSWAKSISSCLFPRPICRGKEVSSPDECKASRGES